MKLLLEIQSINVDQSELDEVVASLAVANNIVTQYAALGLPAPDWLKDKVDTLAREVKARHRDLLELRLKQAKQRRERLKTRDEQKADVDAEIAALEKSLA